MNERLAAMLQLATLRDGMVVRLLLTSSTVMLSAFLLHTAPIPPRVRSVLINLQMGIFLLAWVALLLTLDLLGRMP